eukprot:1519970-Pyramimonas_sp.AAC.1
MRSCVICGFQDTTVVLIRDAVASTLFGHHHQGHQGLQTSTTRLVQFCVGGQSASPLLAPTAEGRPLSARGRTHGQNTRGGP